MQHTPTIAGLAQIEAAVDKAEAAKDLGALADAVRELSELMPVLRQSSGDLLSATIKLMNKISYTETYRNQCGLKSSLWWSIYLFLDWNKRTYKW